MRNVIIQCLLYGSLTFGIWTALLFIYFYHNHVSNWQKKNQETTSTWSLDRKLQQQITHGSGKILRPHVRVQRTNRDETKEQRPFLKLGKYFDFHFFAILRGKYDINFVFERENILFREIQFVNYEVFYILCTDNNKISVLYLPPKFNIF